jgi:hypothetical protein
MKCPWSSLEEVPTLSAVAAEWRGHMGNAFEAFCAGKLLEKAGRTASSFPCPHKFGCTHEVKPRGNGFVGKCKDDDGTGCEDIPLTAEDVEVWELNRSRLGRAIAWALESEPRELRLLVPRTIQVASFGDGAVSVLLTLPQSRDEFQEVITGLVAESGQPFVLVGPTNRFVDRRCRELLEKRNAEFLDLASCFEIQADGGLRARRPVRELLARFVEAGVGRGVEAVAVGARAASDKVVTHGRLRYLPGFDDVWLGEKHYDLRDRTKARLCIQYLVEKKAFGAKSARHLTKEIDPYVRKHGAYLPSVEIKIDHYFNDPHDPKKRLPGLRKELIAAAGRNGRYFLKVN